MKFFKKRILYLLCAATSGCGGVDLSSSYDIDHTRHVALMWLANEQYDVVYEYLRDTPQAFQDEIYSKEYDGGFLGINNKIADADEFYNSSDVLGGPAPTTQFIGAYEGNKRICMHYQSGGFVVSRYLKCFDVREGRYVHDITARSGHWFKPKTRSKL